jgi:hypothetical protein
MINLLSTSDFKMALEHNADHEKGLDSYLDVEQFSGLLSCYGYRDLPWPVSNTLLRAEDIEPLYKTHVLGLARQNEALPSTGHDHTQDNGAKTSRRDRTQYLEEKTNEISEENNSLRSKLIDIRERMWILGIKVDDIDVPDLSPPLHRDGDDIPTQNQTGSPDTTTRRTVHPLRLLFHDL